MVAVVPAHDARILACTAPLVATWIEPRARWDAAGLRFRVRGLTFDGVKLRNHTGRPARVRYACGGVPAFGAHWYD